MKGFGVWGSWVPLRKNSADVPIHQHVAGLLREGKKECLHKHRRAGEQLVFVFRPCIILHLSHTNHDGDKFSEHIFVFQKLYL